LPYQSSGKSELGNTCRLGLLAIGWLAIYLTCHQNLHGLNSPSGRQFMVSDSDRSFPYVMLTSYEFLGDVVYANILGQELVILNSMEAVNDLFDTRSQNYSDRPIFTMVGELMKAENVSKVPNEENPELTPYVLVDGAKTAWYRMEE
jgi:hypothetical protein